MGKLVNLRTIKKQRARAKSRDDATAAPVNKSERDRVKALNSLEIKKLESHKRDGES